MQPDGCRVSSKCQIAVADTWRVSDGLLMENIHGLCACPDSIHRQTLKGPWGYNCLEHVVQHDMNSIFSTSGSPDTRKYLWARRYMALQAHMRLKVKSYISPFCHWVPFGYSKNTELQLQQLTINKSLCTSRFRLHVTVPSHQKGATWVELLADTLNVGAFWS
jgi:hypothetical protein